MGGIRPEGDVRAALDECAPLAPSCTTCAAISHCATIARASRREAWEKLGPINALVNNAGRAPRMRADLLDATEDSFEELLRANLQGPYFLTQAIARQQVEQRHADPLFTASIVFVTSVSADMASTEPRRILRQQGWTVDGGAPVRGAVAEHGIPVYEVRPGIVANDMTAGVRELYDRRMRTVSCRKDAGVSRGRRSGRGALVRATCRTPPVRSSTSMVACPCRGSEHDLRLRRCRTSGIHDYTISQIEHAPGVC